jgi:hypothetical protein
MLTRSIYCKPEARDAPATIIRVDNRPFAFKNLNMEQVSLLQAEQDLEKAISQAYLPVHHRDTVMVQQACDRMDRMREELRSRIGTVDVSVQLIRDVRDDEVGDDEARS